MVATGTAPAKGERRVLDALETSCCVVGGGPAGMILAYLLARSGIPVTLLESHKDFDREFRGDTVHPSTLEILDTLGLADRLLAIPHADMQRVLIQSPAGSITLADLGGLKTKFPYIALVPQAKFLDLLAEDARRFPTFRLVLGANVKELIDEGGVVRGVRYQGADGWHEVRAPLTVAADGRFSRLRTLAGLEPVKTSPPMDVLWFSLAKAPGDPTDADGTFRIRSGRMLITLDRYDHWQLGYIIPKGGYQQVKAQGIEAFRAAIAEISPHFGDRVGTLADWTHVVPLAVESSRLRRWHLPGLLFIGDAAHVMSPVGGVGINYAIQDAVVASNLLADRLRSGQLDEGDLAEVQRRRELPTRIIQAIQAKMQDGLIGQALDASKPFRPPAFLKLSPIRRLMIRLIAFGPRHVRVETPCAWPSQERAPGPAGSVAVS